MVWRQLELGKRAGVGTAGDTNAGDVPRDLGCWHWTAGHYDWLVPLWGVTLVSIDCAGMVRNDTGVAIHWGTEMTWHGESPLELWKTTYLALMLIDHASVVRSDAGVVGHWGMETTWHGESQCWYYGRRHTWHWNEPMKQVAAGAGVETAVVCW